jgi:hypothetical protein
MRAVTSIHVTFKSQPFQPRVIETGGMTHLELELQNLGRQIPSLESVFSEHCRRRDSIASLERTQDVRRSWATLAWSCSGASNCPYKVVYRHRSLATLEPFPLRLCVVVDDFRCSTLAEHTQRIATAHEVTLLHHLPDGLVPVTSVTLD